MAMRARTLLIAASGIVFFAILPTVGCTSILGDFELAELTQQSGVDGGDASTPVTDASGTVTGDSDGSTDDSGPPQQGDGGGGDGGPVARPCTTGDDCALLPTTPPRCAVAHCLDGKCVYEAIDKDGDGHKMANCVANDGTTSLPGDDCNDNDPTVWPGAPCRFKEDGTPITYPNNVVQGLCKEGLWDCSSGKPVCRGAIAPAAAEDCNLRNDANCNGIPDDGCPALQCTYNVSPPKTCGNINNKPLPCKTGTQTCTVNGQWSACVGNVDPKPRDCTSTVDNDCNAGPDNSEPGCSCPGPVAVGGTQACTVPNKFGACAVGTRTCQLTADKTAAVFSDCIGPAPGPKNCTSPADNDCNGIPDQIEVGCGSPCKDANGNPTVATQKFTPKIWGCAGKYNWPASTACASPAVVCSVATWVSYFRGAGAAAKQPGRHYWTSDHLQYGSVTGACYASALPPNSSAPPYLYDCGANPMKVCASSSTTPFQSVTDVDGNVCNWTNCSNDLSGTPNDYLGGCSGNTTAGALCCTP
jgi:hypothetical protein